MSETFAHFRCPCCGRVSSVPEWIERPICVHAWEHATPEIWDGNDTDGRGRHIEWSPNEEMRFPGPETWADMIEVVFEEKPRLVYG